MGNKIIIAKMKEKIIPIIPINVKNFKGNTLKEVTPSKPKFNNFKKVNFDFPAFLLLRV